MTVSQNGSESTRVLNAGQVAEMVGGRVEGDPSVQVGGVAPLNEAQGNELGFLAGRRYLRYLVDSDAGALLVSEDLAKDTQGHPSRVVVKDPHATLPILLPHFYPEPPATPGIHPTAVLGKGVVLGENVTIGPYAVLEDGVLLGDHVRIGPHSVIGAGCVVGADSLIHPHVVLYPGTRLGARVILHAGARLGVDGFGYVPGAEGIQKIPQVGACVVEDDVEVGANTCIDRGSIGQTAVGRFTKLDNLVHLAHNVRVGQGVLMAAMTGVAGSVEIGDGVMTGGQAGISGHLEVGAGARVAAQGGVIGDVAPGSTVSGYPARDHREYLRAMSAVFKLPETLKRLKGLEARLTESEDSAGE
jgi:UDP-3-O-[3-hydroxymyristoyl] glucosamine N-acyltransferase